MCERRVWRERVSVCDERKSECVCGERKSELCVREKE